MPTLALTVSIATAAALAVAVMWLLASRRRLAANVALFSRFMEHGPFPRI